MQSQRVGGGSLPTLEKLGPRILIVGCGGKTTLAKTLGRRLNCPVIEMDAINWLPNWQAAPLQVFRDGVAKALEPDCWVADGNYSKAADISWSRATGIIWLDYPLWFVLARTARRTVKRIFTREELWYTGNRETLRNAFASKDSLFLWHIQTHRRKRRRYEELLSNHFRSVPHVRLRGARQTRAWLERD